MGEKECLNEQRSPFVNERIFAYSLTSTLGHGLCRRFLLAYRVGPARGQVLLPVSFGPLSRVVDNRGGRLSRFGYGWSSTPAETKCTRCMRSGVGVGPSECFEPRCS